MNTDGYDRLDSRLDRWSNDTSGRLADHPKRTIGGWVAGFVGLLILLSIVAAIVGFVNDWGREAKRVVSPANVTQQYDTVITDWQDLQASADNACTAQESADKTTDDPVLIESPAQAYAATYRRIAVDFNSRQQNIFKAGKVGPPGYPKIAPVVPAAHPNWCAVSDNLRAIHP